MQNFKAVSFPNTLSGKSKVVSLGFNEREYNLFLKIAKLSSQEIRRIISIDSYEELIAQADKDKRPISLFIKIKLAETIENESPFATSDITFKNSKSIPFQRWYPYAD